MGSVLGTSTKFSTAPNLSGQTDEEVRNDYLETLNRKNQLFGAQANLAQVLQQQMAGQGPNPAQLQYQNNIQNNIANAQGLIASQRGLNPALAARMGANAAAQGNQQAALGSALLQQQQQLAATSNLGNLYGQEQQGILGYSGLEQQAHEQANGINAGIAQGDSQRKAGLIGGVINTIGGAASKGATAGAGGAAHGGYVSGGKINAPGDSPSNDTVPAMLSPGEIIIPRSKAHDPEKAKEFIDALLKNEGKSKKSDGSDYGEVIKARRKRASK